MAKYLGTTDYAVMVCYFAFLVGLGLVLRRKASASVEDYFLGGRQLPWWALGVSGMASFLDLTGTMVIVSFLYMIGPRGLFVEFRGGAVLVLAVMMLWSGKWHRRSGCITNAEWMIYRFGNTAGGQFARMAGAIAAIVSNIAMVTYLIKGTGLFVAMFLPFSPQVCAVLMIGVATLYILTAGFYGVVYTDLFQSGIILAAVIVISVIAYLKNPGAEQLSALAYEVTGQSAWMTSACSWKRRCRKGMNSTVFYLWLLFFIYSGMSFTGWGLEGSRVISGPKTIRSAGN